MSWSLATGSALRDGIDILVGTPGRILDWVNQGRLDTSKLQHVVLDEVDQMLDMGFADDVDAIISYAYQGRGEFTFIGPLSCHIDSITVSSLFPCSHCTHLL